MPLRWLQMPTVSDHGQTLLFSVSDVDNGTRYGIRLHAGRVSDRICLVSGRTFGRTGYGCRLGHWQPNQLSW